MRVADFIVEFLIKEGVRDVFLLPGGGAMYLIDAFGNNKNINFVAMHHEQSVSIAAEAYGRVKESFGVGIVTTGPGATNAITGVVGAYIESTPLLMISGQVKRADMKKNKPIRQSGVQEVDIVSMVKNYTKYAVTVEDKNEIKYHLQKAIYLMNEGRKGPVWLDIPLDIQGAKIDLDNLKEFIPPKKSTKLDISNVIDLINSSKKPLILAGHGIRLSNSADIFKKLINKLKIPIITTWNASDLIEFESEFFAGKAGLTGLRSANFCIQNCDLLIVLGSRVDNIITAYNPKRYAKNAKKIIVEVDENEVKNSQIKYDEIIISDLKEFLIKLEKNIDRIKGLKKEWVKRCNKLKYKYRVNKEFDFEKMDKFSHFEFAYILSKHLKGGEIIATGSSGLGIEAFYVAFEFKKNQRMFLTSGLGAMGYGLPAAIGASIANNKNKIIAVESDGSLQLNIQEFAVIKGLNLPILMFIMDNSGYASIKNTQKNYFNSKFVAVNKNSKLFMPDINKISNAYGIKNFIVKNKNELIDVLKIWDDLNEAVVVVVKLNEDEVLMPKSSAIIKDDKIYSMPIEDMSPLLPLEELKENVDEIDEISIKVREHR